MCSSNRFSIISQPVEYCSPFSVISRSRRVSRTSTISVSFSSFFFIFPLLLSLKCSNSAFLRNFIRSTPSASQSASSYSKSSESSSNSELLLELELADFEELSLSEPESSATGATEDELLLLSFFIKFYGKLVSAAAISWPDKVELDYCLRFASSLWTAYVCWISVDSNLTAFVA